MLEGRVEDEGECGEVCESHIQLAQAGEHSGDCPSNRLNNPSALLRFLYNSSFIFPRAFPALPIKEETANLILIAFISATH